MDLAEYLAVPYVAVVYSVEGPNGEWLRRAEYPELPGCVVEGSGGVVEVMERLEQARVQYIASAFSRREDIPVPRPPLAGRVCGLSGKPVEWILKDLGGNCESHD